MIVRENINFERGSEDPLSSIGVGRYTILKKMFSSDKEISIEDSMKYLEELSEYVYTVNGKNGPYLRISPILSATLEMYANDEYWEGAMGFMKTLIIWISKNGNKISEREFLEWGDKWLTEIKRTPISFINVINGILYNCQMH